MVEYTSSRLCFKADVIEPLKETDSFVVHTPDGTFMFTKADFYRVFPNVIETKSYQEGRLYSCKYPPKRALPFLISGQKQGDNNTKKQSPKNVHKTNTPQKDIVGDDIRQKIKEIGLLWRNSPYNPSINIEVLKKWDNLIEEWIKDETMPLIIRKETSKRGQGFNHPCGREIIVSDNTVAIWVFSNVLDGKVFTLSDIKELLQNNELPMVFMATNEIKEKAKYTKPLGCHSLPNWKLCHIQPVGFNTNKSIENLDISEIKEHFRKYVNPNNMFVLPKEIGYLGEIDVFIEEQKR
ncbi:hypothetical protein [Prevotella sp. HUN102]|uniref:hypothetical protein n=1 Tax=Prevotella sp. HUN102 TaxID=1392486 RepID=UPI00048AF184|nr:hypothetical protein [Prevotella sp. HUN102]